MSNRFSPTVTALLIGALFAVLVTGMILRWHRSQSLLGLYQSESAAGLVEIALLERGYATLRWGEADFVTTFSREGSWTESHGIVSIDLSSETIRFQVLRSAGTVALQPSSDHPVIGHTQLSRVRN